jgi:4-hydroxy-L-threonine phosphate dehydrogenase PdxA
MAPGWLKKIGNFFRNVGKKVVNCVREAASKVVKVANAIAPIAAPIMKAVVPRSGIAFTGGLTAANAVSNLIKK